jgi:alpha-2-macroglobulin
MFENARAFFGMLIACAVVPSVLAADKDVELLTDAQFLQPTSTLELRFANPVATKDDVGTMPAVSPLEIKPALAGSFTWLSQRSGVFVPSAPPPLGREYLLTVRPGFQDLNGRTVGQDFRAVVKTPAYAITYSAISEDEAASPKPAVRIALNLDTRLSPELFRFVDESGDSVPAEVRYAIASDYIQLSPELLDWNRRWEHKPPSNSTEPDQDEVEKPQPDRLIVTPKEPLDSGKSWHLDIRSGLTAIAGNQTITNGKTVPIGAVAPFTVKSLAADGYIHSGRVLTVTFSRELAPDITPESAGRLLKIEPAVGQLRYDTDGDALKVSGPFGLNQNYQITFTSDLVDRFGVPLDGEHSHSFRFAPVKPRIYLPITSGDQFRNGNRKFQVLSVNIRRLKVRAVLVDPANGPAAKKAFAAYDHPEEDSADADEPNQRVSEDKVRGKVIYDHTIELGEAQIDSQLKTELDWSVIAGPDRGGLIFLTIEGDPISGTGDRRAGAQALIQLSNIGVLWTRESDKLRFSLFSLSSGAPIAAADILLLNENRGQISHATSDSTGSASVAFSPEIEWAVVKQREDSYTLNLGQEASVLPAAGFNLQIYYPQWEAEPTDENVRSFLFTDRPLYRPGDTVHARGFVRRLTRSGLESAKSWKGQATVSNPQGENVFTGEIETDTEGAFQIDIPLRATANGRQSLRIRFGEEDSEESYGSADASFEVADYEPNAFELDLNLPDRLAPTMPISAKVSGKYLFGAPLSRSQVRWTLQTTSSAFTPTGFENFEFTPEDSPLKTTTLTGGGTYDGVHPLVIVPELSKTNGTLMQGVLTVDMTDINQQTVTESRLFYKDPADFYLGISRADNIVIRSGTHVPIRCIAVTPEGRPIDQPIDVHVELIQKRHETVRIKGAGKSVSFRTTDIDETIERTHGQTLKPVLTSSQWVVNEGKTAEVTVPAAGDYVVRATAEDSGGRPVISEFSIYVSGEEEVSWDFRNAAQIDLVPDKPEYQPGETAQILVKSPYSGEAIVNIARGPEILRSQRTTLSGNSPTIRVPITASDSPNIYVSVVLIRGSDASTRKIKIPEFRYGITNLIVADPAAKLRIAITPVKPVLEPGEKVDVDISVKDGSNHPIRDSEVTFFAVDDGVLALTGYQRPDPYATFFKAFPLNVQMGLTMDSLLAEDPQDLQFTNKGYLIGGGGLDIPGAKLRTEFPGTACWIPAIRTDSSGHAKVQFTSPDAITRYRLVAVAFAGTNQFGSAESAIAIHKPLLILPAMTRFIRSGDQLIARAVIRNDSDREENVRVQLLLDEALSAGRLTSETFSLSSKSVRTFDIPIRANKPGTSHWEWSAQSDNHADRVAATMEVQPAGPTLREIYLSDLANKRVDLLTGVNPQLLEGRGRLNVTLSNTQLTSLGEAIAALRTYPYECTEQLTSGLVPMLVANQLKSALPTLIAEANAPGVDKSLALIFGRQTGSGGLALWPNGQPSLFASAYAAWVVANLQSEGAVVPADKWKHLLDYLSQSLRGLPKIHDEVRLNEQAFVLLALAAAGRSESSYYEEFIRRKAELSHETRAILALAMLTGERTAKGVVDSLLDVKATAPESESLYGGSARETALQLLALIRYKPGGPQISSLVRELLGTRRFGRWETTQENAWALLALANYYRASETGGKSANGMVSIGDQSFTFGVTRQKPSWTTSTTLDPAKPIPQLIVQREGAGALFAETQFEVYPTVAEQPRQDRGYSVSRSYQKIGDDGKLQPATDLKVGDRILVTLNLKSNRSGRMVAVDDPVPSICEAINPDFRPQEPTSMPEENDYADFREIHGDRVQFFCNQLRAGDYTFRYLSRVRFAGDSTVPPTKVVEMYRPERFGLSQADQVTSSAVEGE